ncbi:cytokine receptor-like factor 2 isoform X2 [Ranitomeya imitator]|uniref:cytokine receptor-like factor 2 isoform X2 n=1 Tax=Ranitomeya imitator TaxID=111125 RepID=UPI0037E9878C
MLFLLLFCFALPFQTEQTNFKGPPKDITLIRQDKDMVIQSSDVQYIYNISRDCFKVVMQLKTNKEMQWQKSSTSSECSEMGSLLHCKFSNPNLDPEKCFHAQLKFETDIDCTIYLYESEWSNSIFIKNVTLVESCEPTVFEVQDSRFFIILFSAVSTLIIFVIVFLRCNMERIKSCIFPRVPDPKNSFHNLFDGHNGYFQEWVKTAASDPHQEVVDCVMDEQNDEPISTYLMENKFVIPVYQPVIEEQEDNVTPVSLQEEASNLCIANINFTLNESMYVML